MLKVFSALGIGISILGAAFAALTNWGLITDWGIVLQGRVMFLIVAITLAHISLLMRINTNNLAVNIVRGCTIGAIFMVALILFGITAEPKLISIYSHNLAEFQRSLWMLLAISGILDVLGTLSVPILHQTVNNSSRDLSDELSEQSP
ncbi:MAG: hypothetical protein COA78_28030 [Blastopirellula sp.]|nr:MAG: hypothetical protein COA78_28030 [Blastopirellula sp.]